VQSSTVPAQSERVSPYPIGAGLYYRKRNGGSHRGIHRVTAAPERIQAGLSGQRLTGSHHPMGRKHRLALPRKYQALKVHVHACSSSYY